MTTVRQATVERAAGAVIERLREQLEGRVILPDDPEYEAARVVVAGHVDKHPAAIARVANARDVALAIAAAREAGLELAVRSGGHSGAGHGTTEGGLVIDVRDMKKLEIDAVAGTAWADAGLTAGEVTSVAWEHGLAIGFGDTGSVGIAGITLGGGIGYLVRKHGLTIDNLLAAEIVTADGRKLTADADNHPDLFWAIRGGGGNFGVATRFKFRLQPMNSFVGGMLVLPATAESVAGFIAAAEAAPEELSTIANVMNCPPFPGVPDEVVGQIVNMAFLGWSGDVEAGERAMAPFRALAKPIIDDVKARPYPEMYPSEEDGYRPLALGDVMFLDHIDQGEAQTMLDALSESDASLRAVQIRVLGGAMARVPDDATAFAHRQRRIMAIVVNFYEGAEDLPRRRQWVKDLVGKIDQGVPGAYVNFLDDDGESRVHDAYPGETYRALAHIKARYDPDNVFQLNQNVAPAR